MLWVSRVGVTIHFSASRSLLPLWFQLQVFSQCKFSASTSTGKTFRKPRWFYLSKCFIPLTPAWNSWVLLEIWSFSWDGLDGPASMIFVARLQIGNHLLGNISIGEIWKKQFFVGFSLLGGVLGSRIDSSIFLNLLFLRWVEPIPVAFPTKGKKMLTHMSSCNAPGNDFNWSDLATEMKTIYYLESDWTKDSRNK